MPAVTHHARAVSLAMALLLAHAGPARAGEPEPISPDRASITSNATVVPPASLQIETGVEFQRGRAAGEPAAERFAVPALIRLGLSERLELRLGGEPVVRLRGPADDTGFGDLVLSLKGRFLDQAEAGWWPALGVQPFFKIPTAREPRGSERPDLGAVLIASKDLPWGFSIDANAGVAAIGQARSDDYIVQALVSGVLNRDLVLSGLSGFVELAFGTRAERDGRDTLLFNAGLVYVAAPGLAFDVSAATTLFGRGPDYALRAGVTARFGR